MVTRASQLTPIMMPSPSVATRAPTTYRNCVNIQHPIMLSALSVRNTLYPPRPLRASSSPGHLHFTSYNFEYILYTGKRYVLFSVFVTVHCCIYRSSSIQARVFMIPCSMSTRGW